MFFTLYTNVVGNQTVQKNDGGFVYRGGGKGFIIKLPLSTTIDTGT